MSLDFTGPLRDALVAADFTYDGVAGQLGEAGHVLVQTRLADPEPGRDCRESELIPTSLVGKLGGVGSDDGSRQAGPRHPYVRS